MATKVDFLTDDELANERSEGIASIFAQADTVLSGKRLSVQIERSRAGLPDAAGWSDARSIHFNGHKIDMSTMDGVVEVTGLNYHELGHIMWTPGEGTGIFSMVKNAGLFWAYNILEDQRLESMMTAQYASTIPYFTTMMLKWVLTSDHREYQWPLAHGRKYLPAKVRLGLRDLYHNQKNVSEISNLIDRYRYIVYPQNAPTWHSITKDAFGIIQDFARLVRETDDPYHEDGDTDKHEHGSPTTEGQKEGVEKVREQDEQNRSEEENAEREHETKKNSKANQEEETEDDGTQHHDNDDSDDFGSEADEDTESDEEGDGDDPGTDDGGRTSDEDDSWDESGSDATDGDGSEEGEDESGDGGSGSTEGEGDDTGTDFGGSDPGDSGEEGSEAEAQDGSGSSGGPGSGEVNKGTDGDDFDDLLEEEIEKTLTNDDLRNEVQNIKRKAEKGNPDRKSSLPQAQWMSDSAIHPTMLGASKRLGQAFTRLAQEIDPGWNRFQPSGRLNVQRAMFNKNLDELFDQWDEGHELALDMEVVILLDRSSSMMRRIDDACQTMWVLKAGFESVNADVTVLGYADSGEVIMDKYHRASRSTYKYAGASGGTDPLSSLAEARRLLHYSKRSVKYVFILTDGEFDDDIAANEEIQRLNEAGAITVMVFIETGMMSYMYRALTTKEQKLEYVRHNAQIVYILDDLALLPNIAKQVITATVRVLARTR